MYLRNPRTIVVVEGSRFHVLRHNPQFVEDVQRQPVLVRTVLLDCSCGALYRLPVPGLWRGWWRLVKDSIRLDKDDDPRSYGLGEARACNNREFYLDENHNLMKNTDRMWLRLTEVFQLVLRSVDIASESRSLSFEGRRVPTLEETHSLQQGNRFQDVSPHILVLLIPGKQKS